MSTLKFFTHGTLKNCHLELTPNGCIVWVSLNVSKEVGKHLSSNNVYNGNKMLVYALKLEVTEVNTRNISDTYDLLLKRCMISIREAKKKAIDKQILILSN